MIAAVVMVAAVDSVVMIVVEGVNFEVAVFVAMVETAVLAVVVVAAALVGAGDIPVVAQE